jgi:hypothetical protein
MAHAQKPDFVFRRNGRVHLNRRGGGASVQSTTCSRGVCISGSNAGYTMFRSSVKGTGYPLATPVSLHFPSRASTSAITFQLDSIYEFFFSTYTLQPSRLIVRSGLDVPTFAIRRLHACPHARTPSGGRWNCGREMSGNFA